MYEGSNLHWASIGPDIGLAPNRRQAIIQGLVSWHIYESLKHKELNKIDAFITRLPCISI